jgi:hypothetical protein
MSDEFVEEETTRRFFAVKRRKNLSGSLVFFGLVRRAS